MQTHLIVHQGVSQKLIIILGIILINCEFILIPSAIVFFGSEPVLFVKLKKVTSSISSAFPIPKETF